MVPAKAAKNRDEMGMRTDTERLDFLLQFFEITDIGDETYVLGVLVDHDSLEERLSFGVSRESTRPILARPGDSMRDIIDKAISEWGK